MINYGHVGLIFRIIRIFRKKNKNAKATRISCALNPEDVFLPEMADAFPPLAWIFIEIHDGSNR